MSYKKTQLVECPYKPVECQARVGSGICDETATLDILDGFQKMYEDKLKQIDNEDSGECLLQKKLNVQSKWIENLTEQTKMMAQVVTELEIEAADRVKILEEKLQQNGHSVCEQLKTIENKDKLIVDLNKELQKAKLFGDIDEMARLLKEKNRECENLKQSMMDMRYVLTEEVACKHDVICAQRRDIQKLEERCMQSNKQTAFKDDIIKELRKEIKQLKQQQKNNNSGDDTTSGEEKSCKCSHTIDKELPCSCNENSDREYLTNQNNIIEVQNNTINVIESELKETRQKKCEIECELEMKCDEIRQLKNKIDGLQKIRSNSQSRAGNLQTAVDLYLNSIKVLESKEENARIEIERQRETIFNLQEALVRTKKELDEIKTKSRQDAQNQQEIIDVLRNNLTILHANRQLLHNQYDELSENYRILQDLNFDLEVKYFINLQDLEIFEGRLEKYQKTIKELETNNFCDKTKLSKLSYQKCCNEEVLRYFKFEMESMADHLKILQDILNLSRTEQDQDNLNKVVANLKKINERLRCQVCCAEKEAKKSNQARRQHQAKIDELEKKLDELKCLKSQLEMACTKNNKLHDELDTSKNTIKDLQCLVDCYNKEKESTAKLQLELEEKKEKLKSTCKELEQTKKKQKSAKSEVDELKCKQEELQEMVKKLKSDSIDQKKYAELVKKESIFKKAIIEFRHMFMDLFEQLVKDDKNDKLASMRKSLLANKSVDVDTICQCEMRMFQQITICIKDAFTKLFELNNKSCKMAKEKDQIDAKLATLQKKLKKAEEKLSRAEKEEKRLQTTIHDLEKQTDSIADTKEDIATLKKRIKGMTERQNCLIEENKTMKLKYEDKYCDIVDKLSKMRDDYCGVVKKKKNLDAENEELKNQVQCLKCCYDKLERRHRYLTDCLNTLEVELSDTRTNRDQICQGSRQVLDDIRNWLDEQKRVDQQLHKKACDYRDTIEKLKRENLAIVSQIEINEGPELLCPRVNLCQSAWSLDSSQLVSPVTSRCPSINEWYNSPNYRDDYETDEDYVNRLQCLTANLRRNNQSYMDDFLVEKDDDVCN